jgi:hypothetical protein
MLSLVASIVAATTLQGLFLLPRKRRNRTGDELISRGLRSLANLPTPI